MRLSIFCSHELVELDIKANTKDEVIKELVSLVSHSHSVVDIDQVEKDILERESLGSTGVGLGIAFPHARSKGVKALTIVFGRSLKGIPFGSIDRKPVHFFFLVVAPESNHGQHLQVLAKLSLIMNSEENIKMAMEANFPQEILDLMDS